MIEVIKHQVTETCARDQALRILQRMLSARPAALEAEHLMVTIGSAPTVGKGRLDATQEERMRVAVLLQYSETIRSTGK